MQYYLFESSLGFFLFKLHSIDKIALKEKKMRATLKNFSNLKQFVSLEVCQFFEGYNKSYSVIHDILDQKMPKELQQFLELYLPKDKGVTLAVQDKKLANLISSIVGVQCVNGEVEFEIFRCIRFHLNKFLKLKSSELDSKRVNQNNNSLSFSLARNKIKHDQRTQDNSIIHSYSLLDQMQKNLNTFSMRIKESYGWHFPELEEIIKDNEKYIKAVRILGNLQKAND